MAVQILFNCGIGDFVLSLPVVESIIREYSAKDSFFVYSGPPLSDFVKIWINSRLFNSAVRWGISKRNCHLRIHFTREESCKIVSSRSLECFFSVKKENGSIIKNQASLLREWLGLKPAKPQALFSRARKLNWRIVCFGGASAATRRLPLTTFTEFSRQIKQHLDFDSHLILGPHEAELVPLNKNTFLCTDAQKALVHINKADIAIGNDSGICKFVRMCGCPTVSLYGPTDPTIWSLPNGIGAREEIIYHPPQQEYACTQCSALQAEQCIEQPCLSTISPAEIEHKIRKLLSMRIVPGATSYLIACTDCEMVGKGDTGYAVSRRLGIPLFFEKGFDMVQKVFERTIADSQIERLLFEYGLFDLRRTVP